MWHVYVSRFLDNDALEYLIEIKANISQIGVQNKPLTVRSGFLKAVHSRGICLENSNLLFPKIRQTQPMQKDDAGSRPRLVCDLLS